MIDELVLFPFNSKSPISCISRKLDSHPGKSGIGTTWLLLTRLEHKAEPLIPAEQEPVLPEVLISEGVGFPLCLQQKEFLNWTHRLSHGHSGVLASKSVGKGHLLS